MATAPAPLIPRTLPTSLETILNACETDGIETAADAIRILKAANVQREDLQPWADFNHPVRDGYGRRAVKVGPHYELMIMSWNPGDFSAIHDHGNTQWGAVLYFGTAEHASYKIDGDTLCTKERTTMTTGQINPVDHDLIHQMGNASDQPLMSLHLYGCQEPVDGVTGDARIFDLLNQEIQTTDGGVFYCLEESLINTRRPGLKGDKETAAEHHRQVLNRIAQIQASRTAPDLKLTALADQLSTALRQLS